MNSGSNDDWLTWPQAAALVGCPVPTIDWHTRTGRIEKRPKVGTRPSLKRSSVEEFALWWRQREAERHENRAARQENRAAQREIDERRARHRARAEELGIRPGRIPPPAPQASGWLTTHEAAALLKVSAPTAKRLARDAGVRAEKVGNRWWLDEDDVRNLAGQRSRWVSFAQAADMVGCSQGALKTAVRTGRIRQRTVHRSHPSLDRASVVEYAEQWAAKRQQRQAERAPRVTGPPDDEDVWLDTATTALVLGISRSRVSQLALAERLPSVTRGKRRWFRRLAVEQAAAARTMSNRTTAARSVRRQ